MPPGRPPASGFGARLLAVGLALLAVLAAPAAAQVNADTRRAAIWETVAADAEAQIAEPSTSTAELEVLRERLVGLRTEAQTAERENAPTIAELNSRLQALGPPPAEGADEAPEIADRRKALSDQLAAAQVPVLEAQEAYQRVNALIDTIDSVVRARFTAELRSQGPSPLRPQSWLTAIGELRREAKAYRTDLANEFSTPAQKAAALRRLPVSLLMVVAGIAITFVMRRWLVDLIEGHLAEATSRRAIAWLVALRNIGRLIMPAVGAGLIFAALTPENLSGRVTQPAIIYLPGFILALIWAGWLGSSLFAPRLAAYRLLPVDDADARRGTWLTLILGTILAMELLLTSVTSEVDVQPATISVLYFPLICAGAATLWRTARLIAGFEGHLATEASVPSDQASGLGLRVLRLAVSALRAVALLGPVLAALGYFAAANFLIFPSILTLGLIGSCLVIFALLSAAASLLVRGPGERIEESNGGLIPVIVAALVALGALPLLSLIWGARPSDLGDLWMLLRDGVTLGGIRVSATAVVKLVLVLGIGIAATRLAQVLLRGWVLPRTRLDAGGRNAVLAGVGYIGYFVAGVVAISAAGLDLSNIAIVAGALSVGIGFGLQNIVSNFVSGIILLVERPIKEGDWIEVGTFSGHVRGISVRSTEIETFDRASVILPNSDLIAGTVLNRTHKGMSGRLQVPVSVPYDADPKRVEEILLSIAEGHPLVLEDPGPRVLFMNLGPDTMDFEIRAWLRDVNYSLSARSDMNFEIVARLADTGIRVQPYARDTRPPPESPPPAEPPNPA